MFLTIATSYYQSGQAKRDKLNNLLAWRDDPTSHKLEELALYYINKKKYKELKALCLDAEYIIALAQAFPQQPNFYKNIAKNFLFQQATTYELVARVSLLERLFYSLAMQNVETFDEELFDYIDENLTNNVRVRFCFSLIIYTRWLLDKKQVNLHMSEKMTRLVDLLQTDLENSDESNDSEKEPSWSSNSKDYNPEKKEIKKLVKLCYPVILDFDSQLSFSLSELMKKDELIIFFSDSIKRSNQDLIARIIQSKGRLNLNQFDYIIESKYSLLFVKKILQIIIFYEKIRVLNKNDLDSFKKELKQITEKYQNYHNYLEKIYLEKICYIMASIIFYPVGKYKYRTEFYQYFISIWNAYFPYEKLGSFTYVHDITLALSAIYSFEETIIHLRELKAWNELSNFKKFYVIFILRNFSEKAPAMVQARNFVPEIANMKIWKLSWLVEKLSNFIRRYESKRIENENKKGNFKFKIKKIESIYPELEDIANNYFAGDNKVLKHILVGYSLAGRDSHNLYLAKDLAGTKGQKLKKKIVLLCQMKKGSRKITSQIAYPYEKIPHGINSSKPKLPFLLPYKYVKSARYLFSRFRKDAFGNLEFNLDFSLCNFQLLPYEYFIPTSVYYRFFYVPPAIIDFNKEQFPSRFFFLTEYYRCWQLKRAMVYMKERQYYKKEIQTKLNNYVEKVKRRFWNIDSPE